VFLVTKKIKLKIFGRSDTRANNGSPITDFLLLSIDHSNKCYLY